MTAGWQTVYCARGKSRLSTELAYTFLFPRQKKESI